MGMMVITKLAPGVQMLSPGRTGTLSHIGAGEIEARLGFPPDRHSIEGQSDHEWRFMAGGTPCSIWDYKGSSRHAVWSTNGPPEVFAALFGWRATR